MHDWMAEMFPIGRSITGDGVRETLALVKRQIPLAVHEVPSGTRVFDWTVPREWNLREAWVKGPDGRRVIDVRDSSLHVLGYSVPVHARMPLAALRPHLFTLPAQPGLIPWRTSYYAERWGFCLSEDRLRALPDGEYEVRIDATLADGSLTYGECVLEGDTGDEVLLSAHVCHPSLANDNLSGIALLTFLARALGGVRLRYSYRFLFIPGTIGSITWLALNEARAARVKHGLVVACVGDAGHSTYKQSRRGDAVIDRAVAHVLRHSGAPYQVLPFAPYGYDERQFCSPGFDLPVGCFMRTPHGRFPEYHTSGDDLAFVTPEALADSLAKALAVVEVLEGDRTFVSLNPKCEPQLGRRGLYRMIGGPADAGRNEMAMLWTLNLSDGRHSLLDIAERSGQPFATLARAAGVLVEHGLLAEAGRREAGE
ncbi:MAG TPA: DUF4910 domain-containing protein [Methylomirabilota bacterium]|nr:DUF4910 domain-containing protein [Methylomirabilota bacterium]